MKVRIVGSAFVGATDGYALVMQGVGAPDQAETIYLLLEHLAANGRARSAGDGGPGHTVFCRH